MTYRYHYHYQLDNDSNYSNEDEFDFLSDHSSRLARRSERREVQRDDLPARARSHKLRPPRTEQDQAFKCGHCKQFIGAPLSGGKHRNHCPNCLYSKHVDRSMPGDRRSDCGSLMAPVGVLSRRNGEQMILHRCLGCGKEAPNRIAADDDPTLLLRIAPVQPLHGRESPLAPEFVELAMDLRISVDTGDEEEDRSA
ncbi:MAG: RNHCP domain-containing protein [Thermomicrobiales bacterium]